MSSFTRALDQFSSEFVASIALSAEQIAAAAESRDPDRCAKRLEAANLNLKRAFPIPLDSLELARHLNDFLLERSAP